MTKGRAKRAALHTIAGSTLIREVRLDARHQRNSAQHEKSGEQIDGEVHASGARANLADRPRTHDAALIPILLIKTVPDAAAFPDK
jgi:hypothetical protein